MSKLLVVLFVLITPLAGRAESILVLGDSISAAYGIPRERGWVALLENRLQQTFGDRFRVINASVSGETTAGGRNRLPALLQRHDPDLVIVELGGNDGLRGMSLDAMEQNLAAILSLSRDSGAENLLVSIALPPSYGVHFNRLYRRAFDDLAEAFEVPHIALGFDALNDRDLLQADGIHPTAEAQPMLIDFVWTELEPILCSAVVSCE